MTKASKGTPQGNHPHWPGIAAGGCREITRDKVFLFSSVFQLKRWNWKQANQKICLWGGLRALIYNKCCLVEYPTSIQQSCPSPAPFVRDDSEGSSQLLQGCYSSSQRDTGANQTPFSFLFYVTSISLLFYVTMCSVSQQHLCSRMAWLLPVFTRQVKSIDI